MTLADRQGRARRCLQRSADPRASAAALGSEANLKQGTLSREGGVGFFVGMTQNLSGESSEPQLSHGPQLALTFPRYNAGTASVSDFAIKAMILPTGDITMYTATLGFGF